MNAKWTDREKHEFYGFQNILCLTTLDIYKKALSKDHWTDQQRLWLRIDYALWRWRFNTLEERIWGDKWWLRQKEQSDDH